MSEETAKDFHLKEVEYLRKEIEYRTLGQAVVERNVVVAISAIYVALATLHDYRLIDPVDAFKVYFWIIPSLVAVAGLGRFFDDHYAIRNIGRYIAQLEDRFDPANAGWQRYRARNPHLRRGWPWIFRMVSWFGLVGLTVLVPVAVWWWS